MPYTAEISRNNPSCFLFLIDQSGSMQDVMDPTNVQAMDKPMVVDGRTYTHTASGRTKAQAVADAFNKMLFNIVLRCTRTEGVRDYYWIGVLGYGSDASGMKVGPAFSGALANKELAPMNEIANNPARLEERSKKVEDGAGGIIEQKVKFPVWLDPVSNGGTPMCQAMTRAQSILSNWVAQHPTSFPPIVFNITDGEWTDSDPTPTAESIKNLKTNDGNVLLFNLHFSSTDATPIVFADDESKLPDDYARLLFRISSPLTSYMRETAPLEGISVSEMSRGFAFNADLVTLIKLLDMGTRSSNLR